MLSDPITQALAPGIALTSVIFYNTSLQSRFVYITGRIRELNREARALRKQPEAKDEERLRSVRAQVDLMSRRSLIIRRAILVLYAGFLNLVVTAVLLLVGGLLKLRALEVLPILTFAAGLLTFLGAAFLSSAEMYLSHRTIVEDIRTSYAP